MKRLIAACFIITLIAGQYTLGDGIVQLHIGRYDLPNRNYEGELLVTVLSGLEEIPTNFGSFCLERHEIVLPCTPYNAAINVEAIKGGEDVSDPLSPKTAWLYDQYLTGAITFSVDYDATQFQYAIWALEDEVVPYLYDETNKVYWNSMATAYYDAALASDWDSIRHIRVLNLGPAPDYPNQDILAPIPEPATIAMLSLGALTLIRKKK
ncbi:MAG: PEP-CTERM sorting domain-containing protein [Sedimentisphaerales bacterium]|nr:PEP-CTERM sorting domain-containing protein [Sedimentisphaerales bacterium]